MSRQSLCLSSCMDRPVPLLRALVSRAAPRSLWTSPASQLGTCFLGLCLGVELSPETINQRARSVPISPTASVPAHTLASCSANLVNMLA